VYTLLDQAAITDMQRQVAENPGAREAQKTLAREVTKIVHGEERTASVERVTATLFGGASFGDLTDSDLAVLAGEIPTAAIGVNLIDALVASGNASSNGEAKRLIEGGAVSMNGEKASEDFIINSTALLKKGKNNFILVR